MLLIGDVVFVAQEQRRERGHSLSGIHREGKNVGSNMGGQPSAKLLKAVHNTHVYICLCYKILTVAL